VTLPGPKTSRVRRNGAPLAVVAVAVLLTLVVVLGGSWAGRSPLSVSYVSARPSATELSVSVDLSATARASVHVGLIPGLIASAERRPVFLFYDDHFPMIYGGALGFSQFVAMLKGDLLVAHSPFPTQFVNAAELSTVLAANPHGILIVATGILPDTVLSNSSHVLESWLENGGELIWAGGALGYAEGHWSPTTGFVYDSLGWAGEYQITGFYMEDVLGNPLVLPSGPLLANAPTNWSQALGLQYNGTMDGANVTQLYYHNGTALGFESAWNVPFRGTSPRTSLAYVPVGKGSVYYFGGGYWALDIGGLVQYPQYLAGDVALLTCSGFQAQPGPAVGNWIDVPAGGTAHLTLSLANPAPSTTLIVTSQVGGDYLFLSERSLPPA
jgi:hypothetical protein